MSDSFCVTLPTTTRCFVICGFLRDDNGKFSLPHGLEYLDDSAEGFGNVDLGGRGQTNGTD